MDLENTNKTQQLENQLNLIINQQAILSQKVNMLLVLNNILIATILGISPLLSWYISIALIFPLASLVINIIIIFPNFKQKTNKQTDNKQEKDKMPKTKYWFNFSKMEDNEIIEAIQSNRNTLEQIKNNSEILKSGYELFQHSLAICFLCLPYLIKLKKR